MTQANIPTKQLSENSSIPVIGYGTFKSKDSAVLKEAIKSALQIGYRHIDCAWVYENEGAVGEAIKEAIELSDGNLKREDLFITGKIWNTFHSKDMVRKCFEDTLSKLQTTYLDLLLCHWPFGYAENTGKSFPLDENGKMRYSDVHYLETYAAMEELYLEGKVKNIGLSNFNNQQVQDVLEHCRVKPVINQFEINPHCPSKSFIEFCQKNGITVTGYAPLGANDRAWLKPEDPVLLENPVILDLAKKYNKTPAQICIRWSLQHNIVVLVKSTTPSRIAENVQVFDFTLSNEDIEKINNIEPKFRYYVVAPAKEHKYYPF